jgi:hypothetical protein
MIPNDNIHKRHPFALAHVARGEWVSSKMQKTVQQYSGFRTIQ